MREVLPAWLNEPPQSLVIGTSNYSRSLAKVFGASFVDINELHSILEECLDERTPQVFADIKEIFIIADLSQSSADVIQTHRLFWQFMEKLSPDQDLHQLITFILLPAANSRHIDALLMHWDISQAEAPKFGLGFGVIGDSLQSLYQTINSIQPCDLPPLEARQASSIKHKAIKQLKLATGASSTELTSAAKNVSVAFKDSEYLLDLSCRPPAHKNGNRLRAILSEVTTGSVNSDDYNSQMKEIAQLLK